MTVVDAVLRCWRYGLLTGAVVGGAMGTILFPVVGTGFGVLIGGGVGFGVGVIESVVLVPLARAGAPVAALSLAGGPIAGLCAWVVFEIVLRNGEWAAVAGVVTAVLAAVLAPPAVNLGVVHADEVAAQRRPWPVQRLALWTLAVGVGVFGVLGLIGGLISYPATAWFAAMESSALGALIAGLVIAPLGAFECVRRLFSGEHTH